jgi:hypothetical protein
MLICLRASGRANAATTPNTDGGLKPTSKVRHPRSQLIPCGTMLFGAMIDSAACDRVIETGVVVSAQSGIFVLFSSVQTANSSCSSSSPSWFTAGCSRLSRQNQADSEEQCGPRVHHLGLRVAEGAP